MTLSSPLTNDENVQQFLLLLGRHERWLQAFVLSLVPNWADADDIVQEVRIRLWQQFDSYDPTKDFGAWARAIAKYQALTYHKRQSRRAKLLSAELVETIAEEIGSIVEELTGEEQALHDCFEKLPSSKRDLLTRYYSGRQSLREMAAELGQKYDAVQKALLRARMTLSDCVDETLRRKDGP